ncbi:MAG: Fic family protein [Propionibacteriaceae bacterium]|jgi:Fic family protein|nr:Fic family protein [Propionibacteriaceae bacterium]
MVQVSRRKEMERLAIDLSWKSSQIEGNAYSLLETERLLKDRLTANGKTQEEAIMLLNHKAAIDFLVEHPDYLTPLSVARIGDVHSLLVKDLGVGRNVGSVRVGVTGTNYRPLDNDFQIREALELACAVINADPNPFRQALLAVTLISYIQPFEDGDKRTARIVANALLMAGSACPLSYRTVDSIDYQKAMLLFYEQGNLSAFKSIFIQQYEFAVGTYF